MLTVLIALGVCIIETLVIVVASPLAKPSLVLRFLPEDVRIAAKDHKEPSKGRQMDMKADYKNWVPKGMIYGLMAGTGVLGAGFVTSMILTKGAGAPLRIGINAVL